MTEHPNWRWCRPCDVKWWGDQTCWCCGKNASWWSGGPAVTVDSARFELEDIGIIDEIEEDATGLIVRARITQDEGTR